MTIIKNHLLTLRPDEPRSNENTIRERTVRSGPAVQYAREETRAHRLYEQTRLGEEGERGTYLAEIKNAVENGTYRPNLEVVAQRLAADLRGEGA